jgi:hypothetical protein
MTKPSSPWLRFWSIGILLAVVNLAVFDFAILFAPEVLQVQFIPDDGYYYLTLARNFIRFGQWTFDGGISLTSGFHLILAYILAGFYKLLQPTLENFVHIGLVFSVLITVITVLIAGWLGRRERDVFFFIVLTLVIGSRSFLLNSISITEWPLVILIAGLYCAFFYWGNAHAGKQAIPFALGLLGSLARSDFGLLPLSFLLSTLVIAWRRRIKFPLRSASSGLIGAVLGVGLILLHNYITTGDFVQSSALMKSYWAQFGSQRVYNASTLGLDVLGINLGFAGFEQSIFLVGVFFISGALTLIILAKKTGQNKLPFSVFKIDLQCPEQDQILILSAALCLAGYSIFYINNGATQNWYTANLTWPVFILFVAAARYLDQRILQHHHFTTIWLSIFTIVSLGVQLLSLYPLGAQTAPWPHQQFNLEAGRYLAQNPLDAYVGSWNAGVMGYYLDGTGLVNIDGLVNNDIYPYAVSNSLPSYLRLKNIQYILDFENVFQPPFPMRGGYDDDNFLSQLVLLKAFDGGQFVEFKYLKLYRINP